MTDRQTRYQTYRQDDVVFQPMPDRAEDLAGKLYGMLTVLGYAGRTGAKLAWWCKCDCGELTRSLGVHLRGGKSKSCGCQRLSTITKHGKSGSNRHPLYARWNSIRNRCLCKSIKAYKYYGGRGVKLCERWHDFDNFVTDMGMPPMPGMQIDRIDNNGNYEPSNCRWVTRIKQQSNRRCTATVTVAGVTKTVTAWAAYNVSAAAKIRRRINQGWCARCAVHNSNHEICNHREVA